MMYIYVHYTVHSTNKLRNKNELFVNEKGNSHNSHKKENRQKI